MQKWSAGSSSGSTVGGQANGMWSNTGTGFLYPSSVVLHSGGNLYVADSDNHRIQFWPSGGSSGITVAGTGQIELACIKRD